jgi:outer membrane murein-binding lipoprotein Lpp
LRSVQACSAILATEGGQPSTIPRSVESERGLLHTGCHERRGLVLVCLRRIDAKIDRLTDDVQDLKHRVTSLEGRAASIRGDMAAMSLRIDRIETRLDRIERRLDLIPAPTT